MWSHLLSYGGVCCCGVLQSAVDIDGHERSLQDFAGKVTVFVNVASKCGYTDANYKGRAPAH